MEGYIKLNRKMLSWGWYSDIVTKAVFIDILLHASYTEREYKGHKLQPGEAVIGRRAMAKRLGVSERQVRTALDHLKQTGEISTSKTTNKFTIVRVEKWALYQGAEVESVPQSGQQATNKRPTSDHKQERNKGKREKGFYYNDDVELDLFKNAYKLIDLDDERRASSD